MAEATGADRARLRDEANAGLLLDMLAHDLRTAHLELDVRVERGVEGTVGSEEERRLMRGLLRRHNGLYAVWDLLSLPGRRLEALDVGSGGIKQVSWAVGLDRFPAPGVDIVADLEDGGLPFGDDAFDHVFAIHVLEHVGDLIGLMRELHRVLRATGVLHVMAPHWRHVNAVADPTHRRFVDPQTFEYFCRPRHPGVVPWRPLMVAASEDTVYADLQPVEDGEALGPEGLARWFD